MVACIFLFGIYVLSSFKMQEDKVIFTYNQTVDRETSLGLIDDKEILGGRDIALEHLASSEGYHHIRLIDAKMEKQTAETDG